MFTREREGTVVGMVEDCTKGGRLKGGKGRCLGVREGTSEKEREDCTNEMERKERERMVVLREGTVTHLTKK